MSDWWTVDRIVTVGFGFFAVLLLMGYTVQLVQSDASAEFIRGYVIYALIVIIVVTAAFRVGLEFLKPDGSGDDERQSVEE